MEKAFHVCGNPWVIDVAIERPDGVFVSQYGGLTLEEVQAQNPGAELMDYDEALALIEASCKTEPHQIDAERFDDCLNILPPVRWVINGDCESFLMSERTNGRVTAIFVKLGDTYWSFEDDCGLSHSEIIAKVRVVMDAQEKAATN